MPGVQRALTIVEWNGAYLLGSQEVIVTLVRYESGNASWHSLPLRLICSKEAQKQRKHDSSGNKGTAARQLGSFRKFFSSDCKCCRGGRLEV